MGGAVALWTACWRSSGPAPTGIWEIRLMDERVGVLRSWEHQTADGRAVHSEREYTLGIGGRAVTTRSEVDLELDRADRLRRYARRGQLGDRTTGGFPGAVYVVEEARGPLAKALAGEPVSLLLLDPISLTPLPATLVAEDADTVRWRTPVATGTVDATPEGRLVGAAQGPVSLHRVAEPLAEVEPPDVARLLGRPTAPIPGARRSRVAVLRVDGAERRVEAPLPQEIPRGPIAVTEGFEAELAASPGIEVGAPPLQAVVDRVARVAKDRRTAVELLVSEVQRRVDHASEPGLPSALGALASGSGDCNEHAALFAGLARTMGIPARRVGGVLYLDEPAPGFYPHEWNEVYMGEPVGWVAVDASFGQPIADAARWPLVREGEEPLWRVLEHLASLELEVVTVR